MQILGYFSKYLTTHAGNLCAFARTMQNVGNYEKNFRKFSKFFLRKLLKVHYFGIFFKEFNKIALIFCVFGQKTQIVGKFSS